jgi:hypothetical protein
MKTVQFKDLSVNSNFTLDNKEYVKLAETKISCCKSINACEASNKNVKVSIKPLTQVEISE